jgi:hypothetical protein
VPGPTGSGVHSHQRGEAISQDLSEADLLASVRPGERDAFADLVRRLSVWRIDRIFLGSDGPWIVTQTTVDGDAGAGMYPGQAGNDAAVTHRSPDPLALQNLLSSLGLGGPAAGRPVGTGDVTPFETPVAAAVDARAGSPWWWAMAGWAVGVMLTAVAARFLPAVRSRLAGTTADDQPADRDDGLIRMTPLLSRRADQETRSARKAATPLVELRPRWT